LKKSGLRLSLTGKEMLSLSIEIFEKIAFFF